MINTYEKFIAIIPNKTDGLQIITADSLESLIIRLVIKADDLDEMIEMIIKLQEELR